MRYWAYLAGKLLVAALPLYGVLRGIEKMFPATRSPDEYTPLSMGTQYLMFDLCLLGWFLLCSGSVALIIWDQRRRCRVCLHRLRMPVETGSWGFMLQLGRPRIEYICPYGHGTLKQDELQIDGLTSPEWKPNSDDIWEDLCASSKDAGKEP